MQTSSGGQQRRGRFNSGYWMEDFSHKFGLKQRELSFIPMACRPEGPQLVESIIKSTNDVLCRQYRKCFDFHLPAYVRLTVQDIHMIDLQHANAQISAIMNVSVYYGELPVQFVDQLHDSILMEISNRFHVCLKQRNFDQDFQTSLKTVRNEQTKVITFILRGMFPAVVTCDVFWTPFERLKLSMVTVLTCQELTFLGKPARVNFNIMDWRAPLQPQEDPNVRELSKWEKAYECLRGVCVYLFPPLKVEQDQEQVERLFNFQHTYDFAEYAIIESSRKVTIDWQRPFLSGKLAGLFEQFARFFEEPPSNQQKQVETVNEFDEALQIKRERAAELLYERKIQIKECFFLHQIRQPVVRDVRNWNIITFQVELMRYPLSSLTTILFPVLWLSIMNIFIYYQQVSLANRISNVAMIMLAFVTFLPSIRTSIQQTPKLTLLQILLYLTMLSCFLCLVRSFIDRGTTLSPSNYNIRNDGLSLVSVCLLGLIVLTTVILYLVRVVFFIRKKNNNYKKKSRKADLQDRQLWWNNSCDFYRDSSEQAKKLLPFSTHFFQKQNIFYRLWLHRYSRSFIPSDGEQDESTSSIHWNNRQSLTYYQQQMLEAVKPYHTQFMKFKRIAESVIHLSELDLLLSQACSPLIKEIYQSQRANLLLHIADSTKEFEAYMRAKDRLVHEVMVLQELITEDVEVWFRQEVKRQPIPSATVLSRLALMDRDTEAEKRRLKYSLKKQLQRPMETAERFKTDAYLV